MSAPFLTFFSIPTPLHQHDFDTHNEYHSLESSSSLTTTTYIAIVSRHGKTFTKVLNPSSIANTFDGSSSSSLRGRKRALSGSGHASGFLNPLLLKQSSSLQKKTKLLLFSWSSSSKRNNNIEQQQQEQRRQSSNELTTLTTTGCSFYKLPPEILIRILHHLNTPANVLQVAQTSRCFYNICYDHHLWHRLFSKQYYPLLTPPSEQCFNLYKDHVELDRRWARGDAHVFYMNNEDEHDDSVYATAWINSQTIASVSRDRSIKIWDIETRNCLFTRKDAHQGSILCLTLMQPRQQEEDIEEEKKNELYAVTGSSDSTCIVWSLPNWNQVRQFSAHTHSVLSVLAINDAMVATASRDTTIQIWRITDGKVCHVLRGHTEAVNAVKRLDNQRIVSASGDGTVKIWCIKTGVCLETLTSDIGGLSCMQVINNRTIWAGGLSSHIQIWESTATNVSVWKTATVMNSGHTNLLRTIDSLKGKVITAGYDKVIKVWDSETGKCLLNFQSGHTSKIFSVLLGRTNIISAGHDKRIMVLDFAHQLSKELARR